MTLEELKTLIDNNITTNGKGEITGNKLNNILNNIVSQLSASNTSIENLNTNLNTAVTAIDETIGVIQSEVRDIDESVGSYLNIEKILPFDGIVDSANIQEVGVQGTASIYYVRNADVFAGYYNGKFVNVWMSNVVYTRYNENNKARRDCLYVDRLGNIYAFVYNNSTSAYELTEIAKVSKGYTTHSKVNSVVKELYIANSDDTTINTQLHISQICKQYQGQGLLTAVTKVDVSDENGTVVCSYSNIGEPKGNLVRFTSDNYLGYAIIDWEEVQQGINWFDSDYEGKAYLTNLAKKAELSPAIFAFKLYNEG